MVCTGHISSGSPACGSLCPQRGQGSPRALVCPGEAAGTCLSLRSEAPGRGPGTRRGTGLRRYPSSSQAPVGKPPDRPLSDARREVSLLPRTVQEQTAFAEPPLQVASRQRACSQLRSHPQSKRAPREAGLGVALCLVMSEQHVMGRTQCSMTAQGAGGGQVLQPQPPVTRARGSPGRWAQPGAGQRRQGPIWAFLAFTALALRAPPTPTPPGQPRVCPSSGVL